MTYRELVYMCLDEIKLASDDSYITEDHILFLISKYRAFLLRQKYEKTNMPAPMSNYQLLTVTKETTPIPLPMNIAIPRVVVTLGKGEYDTTEGYTGGLDYKKATYVSPHRFEYVGNNTYLSPFIYCSLDSRNVLQFKTLPIVVNEEDPSKDVSFVSYEIYALFEDCVKASEFNATGDVLGEECPIESELVSGVQELVVKDALGIAYRPKDIFNNGNDDLAQLGTAAAASRKKE